MSGELKIPNEIKVIRLLLERIAKLETLVRDYRRLPSHQGCVDNSNCSVSPAKDHRCSICRRADELKK